MANRSGEVLQQRELASPFYKELQVAKAAALEAGSIIMEGFQKIHEARIKPDNSLVSDIDISAEAKIHEIITTVFPNHAFWGEEGGKSHQESPNLWIVDPLDGSHNFLQDIPIFTMSIAYVENGELKVGVIHDPLHGELFWAEKGKGSFVNNESIHVSSESEFSDTTVGFTRGPHKENKMLLGRIYSTVGSEVRNTRILGSAALHFAYVASGRFDALVNIGNHPWDFAAGILLISEAGGKVTDLVGNELNFEKDKIIASNGIPTIHDPLIRIAKTQALDS